MTKEEQQAYHRKYYQEHRDEILAKNKKWREANREIYLEKSRIKSRKYYQTHRQECLEYHRKYYQKHRDKYISYQRDYQHEYYLKNRNKKKVRPRRDSWELANPELFDNTYNGCSEYSDCLTCPRERCIYD